MSEEHTFEPKLWTEDYFLHHIQRLIMHDISMKFFVEENRKPTSEEYQKIWDQWLPKLKLNITNWDLGIYDKLHEIPGRTTGTWENDSFRKS